MIHPTSLHISPCAQTYKLSAGDSKNDDELKKAREEKMEKARNPRFHFTKYSKTRNPNDFVKGVVFGKSKAKAQQLRWQNTVVNRSLIEFDSKDLNKQAQRLHKNLLGYTGDRSMSFPATLAQDTLTKGLDMPELVDEVYMQLCKHLTHNPRPESQVRAWQVMCMCVGTFPPSRDFENYLLNFILEHVEGNGAVGNYARYSLRRLEGILNSGPSGFVPSVNEIQAYKERPPILATIELVDGTPLTEELPITPDLNVAKVLDICTHFEVGRGVPTALGGAAAPHLLQHIQSSSAHMVTQVPYSGAMASSGQLMGGLGGGYSTTAVPSHSGYTHTHQGHAQPLSYVGGGHSSQSPPGFNTGLAHGVAQHGGVGGGGSYHQMPPHSGAQVGGSFSGYSNMPPHSTYVTPGGGHSSSVGATGSSQSHHARGHGGGGVEGVERGGLGAHLVPAPQYDILNLSKYI